jgi:aarF domain-containing kinase
MPLRDFLRLTQGVSSILQASIKQSLSRSQNATSRLTIYPESPFHSVPKTIKTIITPAQKPPQPRPQEQPSGIFYNTYGNTEVQTEPNKTVITVHTEPIEQKTTVVTVTQTLPITPEPAPHRVPIIEEEKPPTPEYTTEDLNQPPPTPRDLYPRKVPSSSFSRAMGFGSLGVKLAAGTVTEYFRRSFTSSGEADTSLKALLSNDANAEALATTLCRMRGAALKLGQMLSIQDETLIPASIQKALERVRQAADIMPTDQMLSVLDKEWGPNWREKFLEFDEKPIAAASIGQVHRGVLVDGKEVAIKIQYPGVADSIDSDIRNLRMLVSYTKVLPRGAYLETSMEQARKELKMECDYEREADNMRRFKDLLKEAIRRESERVEALRRDGKSISHLDPPMSLLSVPDVIDELSTKRVLTTELVRGFTIDQLALPTVTDETRNRIARLLLKLCLKELFEFKFMQTDPNWSNFFYDPRTSTLHLIDFGACMDFPKKFVDEYLRVVYASATEDEDVVIDASRKMGFLTGDETEIMNKAHAQAAIMVGEPFSRPGIYDFKNRAMPKRVTNVIPTMLKHRLTPPPPVTYSLHRKLSGAFLLCYKLGAQIRCRDIFLDVYNRHEFDDPSYKDTSVHGKLE